MLVTDHCALTTILGSTTGVPSLAAAHLRRWALLLSAYNYNIQFRATQAHANADRLSQLPFPSSLVTEPEQPTAECVHCVTVAGAPGGSAEESYPH